MTDDYKVRELGDKARMIVESEAWQEAWNAYRVRILSLIEEAQSNDTDTVMHLKRLLTAANAAQGHLEMIVKDGIVATATIEANDRKRSMLRRVLG